MPTTKTHHPSSLDSPNCQGVNGQSTVAEILHGDCRQVLPATGQQFDLLFCDPPFNIGHGYAGYHDKRSDFEAFTQEWVDVAWQVCRGVLVLYGPDDLAVAYLEAARRLSMKRIAWCQWAYRFGVCRNTNWIDSRCHLLVFSKVDQHTWNPDAVRIPSLRATKYNDKRCADYESGGTKLPGTVWGLDEAEPNWGRIQGNNAERRPHHPNQLPEKLLERVILAYSNVGDWIADPFCGSGTTVTVAAALGRNCITCDVSESNVESARERLTIGAVHVAPGKSECSRSPASTSKKPRRKPDPAIPATMPPVTVTNHAGQPITFAEWDGKPLAGGRKWLAIDTETTLIDEEAPHLVPQLVLATATDGERGVFFGPDDVAGFMEAHAGCRIVMHHAAFDLPVLAACCDLDVPAMVDSGKLADTMLLARLIGLAKHGHTAGSGLDAVATAYLGRGVEKQIDDKAGQDIRTGFGRYAGKPIRAIPAESLQYAAGDVVTTLDILPKLLNAASEIRENGQHHFGWPGREAVDDAWRRHGVLTHLIQLRASLVCGEMGRNGIGVDLTRKDEKLAELARLMSEAADVLNAAGIPAGGDMDEPKPAKPRRKKGEKQLTLIDAGESEEAPPSAAAAMQAYLADLESRLRKDDPTVRFPRTATGKISTRRDDLLELAPLDAVVRAHVDFKRAEKLHSTYAGKLTTDRIHAQWGYLLRTGRTNCRGSLALQTLPKESLDASARTIRSCLTAAPGHRLVMIDFGQIELVTLGKVWRDQFRHGSTMADVINAGRDVHRLIAGHVLKKDPGDVTKEERQSAKAVSFGRPGGMSAKTLQQIARVAYGTPLEMEEVQCRLDAYEQVFPELTKHLAGRIDVGQLVAEGLNLTPRRHSEATGSFCRDEGADEPAGWLGGMLLKVLGTPSPATAKGDAYSFETVTWLWESAAPLADIITGKDADKLRDQLKECQPSAELQKAVRRAFDQQAVWTFTGRLRAGCNYTASRNSLFQGPAADGGITAMWRLYRAGFRVVAFIHDECVVELPDDEHLPNRMAEAQQIMVDAMASVLAGMRVEVEAVCSPSLSKLEGYEVLRDGTPKPAK